MSDFTQVYARNECNHNTNTSFALNYKSFDS